MLGFEPKHSGFKETSSANCCTISLSEPPLGGWSSWEDWYVAVTMPDSDMPVTLASVLASYGLVDGDMYLTRYLDR